MIDFHHCRDRALSARPTFATSSARLTLTRLLSTLIPKKELGPYPTPLTLHITYIYHFTVRALDVHYLLAWGFSLRTDGCQFGSLKCTASVISSAFTLSRQRLHCTPRVRSVILLHSTLTS